MVIKSVIISFIGVSQIWVRSGKVGHSTVFTLYNMWQYIGGAQYSGSYSEYNGSYLRTLEDTEHPSPNILGMATNDHDSS